MPRSSTRDHRGSESKPLASLPWTCLDPLPARPGVAKATQKFGDAKTNTKLWTNGFIQRHQMPQARSHICGIALKQSESSIKSKCIKHHTWPAPVLSNLLLPPTTHRNASLQITLALTSPRSRVKGTRPQLNMWHLAWLAAQRSQNHCLQVASDSGPPSLHQTCAAMQTK